VEGERFQAGEGEVVSKQEIADILDGDRLSISCKSVGDRRMRVVDVDALGCAELPRGTPCLVLRQNWIPASLNIERMLCVCGLEMSGLIGDVQIPPSAFQWMVK
jgi:hypothetical protein